MLNMAVRNSKKLIREMSKQENIRIGRFFTKRDTAALMAGSLEPVGKTAVTLLDPGAGTGILSAAAIEAIARMGHAEQIHLVCYENNPMFLPMLANNLERVRKKARHDYHVKVRVEIREENFLLAEIPADETYDYVLANPPQEPLANTTPEAKRFSDLVVSGTVDAACLFAAAASARLSDGGQLVAILPLTAATGVSLARIRRAVFSPAPLTDIWLFAKSEDAPLKKQMILRVRRGAAPERVRVFLSTDDGTPEHTQALAPVPYDTMVDPADFSLLLVRGGDEQKVLDFMNHLPCNFDTFHLRVRTGLALESRYPELLRDAPVDGAIPLIHPRSLRGGMVVFPVPGMKNQYIIPHIPSLCQQNKNMLLMKRVPAKSDKRRLMCGVYLAGSMTNRFISTHNKLNYIDMEGNEQMDPAFLYGLLAFLSSEVVDRYVRITSKSGQINATELASMPLPTANQLRTIGAKLMAIRVYKPEYCDRVVRAELFREN